MPTPTISAATPGVDANRILADAPGIQNTRQEAVRIDHTITNNHHLMGRYTHDLSQTLDQGGLFNPLGTAPVLPNIATTRTNVPGQILSISLTSTFGPTIVNEASFNFSSNLISDGLIGQYTQANVNVPNAELFPENNSQLPPFLAITVRARFNIFWPPAPPTRLMPLPALLLISLSVMSRLTTPFVESVLMPPPALLVMVT